ncbi:hypothetical protein B0I35DRAFT_406532 [Stachybotrys elegans]|uniref:Uncharacterized protein n=1 Tax=Stachybotrys elegans TaxID=80388 RepID=A0A8K0T337_9HYPO|nr:hypothetical protein B0I35DRAFT_406532 [Stachybotrys elegans]
MEELRGTKERNNEHAPKTEMGVWRERGMGPAAQHVPDVDTTRGDARAIAAAMPELRTQYSPALAHHCLPLLLSSTLFATYDASVASGRLACAALPMRVTAGIKRADLGMEAPITVGPERGDVYVAMSELLMQLGLAAVTLSKRRMAAMEDGDVSLVSPPVMALLGRPSPSWDMACELGGQVFSLKGAVPLYEESDSDGSFHLGMTFLALSPFRTIGNSGSK